MGFNFQKDSFFKILSFNSLSVVFKILMGVISTKLVSIYLGIQGINTLEFFRNFTSVTESLSAFGTQNGIVKQSALSKSVDTDRRIISSTLFLLFFIYILILATSGLFFDQLQNLLFQSDRFDKFIILYLLSLPVFIIYTVFINFFQGKEFYTKIIVINTIGYILNIVLSIYLIVNYKLEGAILQIIIAPLLLAIISMFIINKNFKIIQLFSFRYFDIAIIKSLLKFSSMQLVSTILAPLSFIFIRNLIQINISVDSASIWSAILRLSSFYMVFINTVCHLYFYPKLIKSITNSDMKEVIKEYFVKFIPITFIGFLLCFLLQNIIIILLYTPEFLVIKDFFFLQILSDFIKTAAMIFGYSLIAKEYLKLYITLEIMSVSIYVTLSYVLIDYFQLNGVFYALIISSLSYLFMIWIVLKNKNAL
ncbi:MAG TPA: oligosaccharide flippase family protein [Flavobacterium sp.]|nr:oligosaccharide flippase family protein [Flavobacterium sp.]